MNWADVTDLKILLVVIWALGNCFWKLKEKKTTHYSWTDKLAKLSLAMTGSARDP